VKPGKRWSKESWGSHRWNDDGRHRDWGPEWRKKGPALFFRFAMVFGFIVLLFFGGLAIAAYLLSRFFGGDGQTAVLVWILGCGLAVALPLIALALAARAFRGIATPLAGVMAAADAVAEGDFSARVPEEGPGDFRQLAHSFNRMASELDLAEQRRRNLTADVAHELRTPLHIIQGNLEGIVDGVYEPSEAQIGSTLDEIRLLSRLVEDLQTLSLAEAGQLDLSREAVNVPELLADVRTSFSGQADSAGVNLFLAVNGESEALTVWGDYGRLDQVMSNLMANSLRHTPSGGVITLQAKTDSDWVTIRIIDTGEGIPAEDLPYIFDRFWRGDRSRPHSGGSSGLGLAIAQQLIQSHDGRIEVASESGRGTTFTIGLPAGSAPPQ
jgi:signal transduction histidine kinase